MSRIHDALKKVDEERFQGEPPQAGARASDEHAGRSNEGGFGRPARPDDAAVAKHAGRLEAITRQCPPGEWAPDPNTMLFYGKEFETPGSEEFRTLRSRLDLVRERQALRTLLITSPLPGEGKTFVAANLAQVIVWQRERHVLLIDGDLRSSRLHLALGVQAAPGLSDYLNGTVEEFAVVRRGPLDNFFFIPGGTAVPNASELIANGRLRNLLRRLAGAFDWIIIDSPPVIPFADARLVAELCEGVLLVVQAGMTPGDVAQLAWREFRGKPFVGVVMNRVNPDYGDAYRYRAASAAGRDTGGS